MNSFMNTMCLTVCLYAKAMLTKNLVFAYICGIFCILIDRWISCCTLTNKLLSRSTTNLVGWLLWDLPGLFNFFHAQLYIHPDLPPLWFNTLQGICIQWWLVQPYYGRILEGFGVLVSCIIREILILCVCLTRLEQILLAGCVVSL